MGLFRRKLGRGGTSSSHPILSVDGAETPLPLQRFAQAYDVATATEAMILACQDLLRKASQEVPPVGLRSLLSICNARIEERHMADAGRLEADKNGFVICIKKTASWRRKRFTIAHEVGHILLLQALAKSPQEIRSLDHRPTWEVVERLCNLAAAELLIPRGDFRKAFEEIGLQNEGMLKLYDRYLISYTPLFIRFLELLGVCNVILWKRHARHSRESCTFRLTSCFRTETGPWLPSGLTVKHFTRNLVEEAAVSGYAATEDLILRQKKQEHQFVGVAVSRPIRRDWSKGQLPLFDGYRIRDEYRVGFEVALFLIAEEEFKGVKTLWRSCFEDALPGSFAATPEPPIMLDESAIMQQGVLFS